MGKQEKIGEKKLIKGLNKEGFKAHHIDASVDGFPDVFAAKHNKILLIEVKDADIYELVRNVFEPTQPVFAFEMNSVGYKQMYAAIYNSKAGNWCLFVMSTLLQSFINDNNLRLCDIPMIVDRGTLDDVIQFLCRIVSV